MPLKNYVWNTVAKSLGIDKTRIFKDALFKQAWRGPDSQNFEVLNNKDFLGHVRLSIIDPSARSNQPLTTEDKRYKIIFNGEIIIIFRQERI